MQPPCDAHWNLICGKARPSQDAGFGHPIIFYRDDATNAEITRLNRGHWRKRIIILTQKGTQGFGLNATTLSTKAMRRIVKAPILQADSQQPRLALCASRTELQLHPCRKLHLSDRECLATYIVFETRRTLFYMAIQTDRRVAL